MCYIKNMSEIIKFPTIQKSASLDTVNKNVGVSINAYFFEDSPNIYIGGEIVVVICGKKHKGVVTGILQKDKNNNITKVAYSIPFLSGDDSLKFGEANFAYKIKKYD